MCSQKTLSHEISLHCLCAKLLFSLLPKLLKSVFAVIFTWKRGAGVLMLSELFIILLAFIFLLSVLLSCIMSPVSEANSWLGNFPRKRCNSLCPYSKNKAAGAVFIQIIADFICPYIMHSNRFKHFITPVWEFHHQILFIFQILVLIPTNPFNKCPFLDGIMSNNFSDRWVLFLLEHDGFL